MQALLLATNESAKLRPLTDDLPLSLLPIVDRPVIALAVENLARAGVRRILVCLGHQSALIAALLGSGGRWGVHIDYLVQDEGRTPAEIVRSAAPLIREAVLVLPADVVFDLDVAGVAAFHARAGAQATQVFVSGDARRPSGAYLLRSDAVVRVAESAQAGELSDVLAEAGVAVEAYETGAYWCPLETFAQYHEAQRVFLYSAPGAPAPAEPLPRVRHVRFEARAVAPGIWMARGVGVHPSAQLAAPLYLGYGARVGRGAEIGPETVVGGQVIIDDEATVARSTVVDGTYIGRMVNSDARIISHTTLIDPAMDVSTRINDTFLLSDLRSMVQASWTAWFANRVAALVLLLAALPAIALLLLGALVSSGHPLRRVPAVVRLPRRPWQPDRPEPVQVSLLAVETLNDRGTPTRFGGWVRRWRLAFLPALWNVLIGEINLVGVKPLTPHEAGESDAWKATRFQCPAGLTGPWYMPEVGGGPMSETMADVFYAATRTRREALGVLLRTPRAWLQRCLRTADSRDPAAAPADALYE